MSPIQGILIAGAVGALIGWFAPIGWPRSLWLSALAGGLIGWFWIDPAKHGVHAEMTP